MKKIKKMFLVSLLLFLVVVPGWMTEIHASDTADRTFLVTVDYEVSLATLIKAGEYDHVYYDSAYEPLLCTSPPEHDRKKVVLPMGIQYYRGRVYSTKDILLSLAKKRWRPASVREFLAFGIGYPIEKIQLPIVAFDTYWPAKSPRIPTNDPYKYRHAFFLYSNVKERCLGMVPFEGRWNGIGVLVVRSDNKN